MRAARALGFPPSERFGVLGKLALYSDAGVEQLREIDGDLDVGHVAEIAYARALRRIFVARDALAWLRLPAELPERLDGRGGLPHRFVDDARARGWSSRPTGLWQHLQLRRSGVPARTSVTIAPYDTASPFAALPARDLCEALALFRAELGVAWRSGPGATAEALIQATHPIERGGVQLRRAPDPPPPATVGTTEHAYTWRRPLTATERKASYVHVFDLNAQYLAAWSSLQCGLDEIEHLDAPAIIRAGVDVFKLPGYWHTPTPPAPSPMLPSPAPGQWHHSESMRLLVDLGVDVDVTDGYVWRRHTRYLEPAYARLRDARADLVGKPGAVPQAVYEAVKRLYQVEYGRFSAGFRFERPDRWLRPDWRHGTIARARANLYRRVLTLRATPFAIHVDALVFASSIASAADFAQRVGLTLGAGLGQFHLQLSAPLHAETLGKARTSAAVMAELRKVAR